MRIAVYGGSFNPPHVGHALVASWILWTGRADEVWLVPSAAHPFGKQNSPFERRVALCEALARSLSPQVRVEAIEGDLPAPTYTIDVLRALAARHPDAHLRLVLGTDNLADLPRWKQWTDIEREFEPLFVGRQGYPRGPAVSPDFPEVSSTEIRARLAQGLPVDDLVPQAVLRLL